MKRKLKSYIGAAIILFFWVGYFMGDKETFWKTKDISILIFAILFVVGLTIFGFFYQRKACKIIDKLKEDTK